MKTRLEAPLRATSSTPEQLMTRTSSLLVALLVSAPLISGTVLAQGAARPAGHVVVVKMVDRGGSTPYAFEPANVAVQPGDTLRFLEDAGVVHNVRFKDHPSGAHLGAAGTGPYLTTKGQTYDLIIDGRFAEGTYTYVCDPHESIGMRGTLTVGASGTSSKQ
jgi:plastocyanin